MQKDLEHITSSPEYNELIRLRNKLIWPLLLLTIGVYMGFILMVGFAPALLATPVGNGVISVGLVVGFLLILFIFAVTIYYVRKANKELQPLITTLHEKMEA